MKEFVLHSELFSLPLKKIREMAHNILRDEVGTKVNRERFFWNNYWIPLSFSIFEGQDAGRCIGALYNIAINKRVINSPNKDLIANILRHEIAHLLTFLNYPDTDLLPHGPEFQQICLKYFNKEVALSRISINEIERCDGDHDKLIAKAQKLLNLGQSSNQHESLLALEKANKLLLYHNLEMKNKHDNDMTYQLTVLEGKRCQEKERSIARIIQEFYVAPLFFQGKNKFFLYVIGPKSNVLFAEYLANFLDRELERLWTLHKGKEKTTLRAKNSFFRGVALGFVNEMKIKQKQLLKNSDDESFKMALTTSQADMEKHLDRAFPRRRTVYSNAKNDAKWSERGKACGKNLNLNRPLTNDKGNSQVLYLE